MKTNKAINTPRWKWLLVIPLLHHLSGDKRIYSWETFDPDKPDWCIKELPKDPLDEFKAFIHAKRYYMWHNDLHIIVSSI